MNIPIGVDFITGQPVEVDTERHIAAIGSSGQGKSTFLENLFIENIRHGNGGIFIDPHGESADRIATLIPKKKARRFIWIDPNEENVVPLNPLYFKDPQELELAKEAYVSVLKALAGTAWGDESERILRGALDAVTEVFPHPTPVHITRFVADDTFRETTLLKVENPFLKMFKEQYDEKLRTSEQMSKFSPIINKQGKLMRPAIISMLGQATSLDFLDIMNKRKIVVCRFSKGRLGEEIAQILGSFIVSLISIYAMRREAQHKLSPFMVIVDEVHNFTHGGRFGSLLAEARKYCISLVTAFQGGYQLPFIDDILSNSATQVAFQASGKDATMLAENWLDEHTQPRQIAGLPRYQMRIKTYKGLVPIVYHATAYPRITPNGQEVPTANLIKHSLMRWGSPRKEVEKKIMKFLAS